MLLILVAPTSAVTTGNNQQAVTSNFQVGTRTYAFEEKSGWEINDTKIKTNGRVRLD